MGATLMVENILYILLASILGFLLGLLSHMIITRHDRFPSNLFKTQFILSIKDDMEKFGEPLILSVNQTYTRILSIETQRVCEFDRIGIRPQEKGWVRQLIHKGKTHNIKHKCRDNPPVRILNIRDVTPRYSIRFQEQDGEDDTACGRWGYYSPPRRVPPGQKALYEVQIEALKLWDGYIDFRWDSPNGRRATHHPCKILDNKENIRVVKG